MRSNIFVNSEIGELQRVLIHRPDSSIARISPKRAEELLFDDIVYLPKMQYEHDIFSEVLRTFLGDHNVIEVRSLIFEALETNEKNRDIIIDYIADFEELPDAYIKLLSAMPNDTLSDVLISGYHTEKDIVFFDPIPNFIFTRDIGVVVNDHIIITKAAKMARYRENLLARFMFWYHPMFGDVSANDRNINLNDVNAFPPSRKGESVSAEGGDIMVINEDYLLIGCSERTSDYAIKSLTKKLFEKKVIKNVVQINIPRDRSYMHIDTIFTQINENHIAAYKPIVVDGISSNVHVNNIDGGTRIYSSVGEFFRSEINPNMEFILSGNGQSPFQEREQWTDGCNLVTVKPGVALTYDRNPRTEISFRDFGYTIFHANEYLKKVKEGRLNPNDLQNTIITLPSHELSRARGGSHCMTCPIQRL